MNWTSMPRAGKGNALRPRARQVDTRGRLKLVAALLGLGCASLVARAVDLQLLHNEFYQREGNARFQRDIPIAASRGMLTDRPTEFGHAVEARLNAEDPDRDFAPAPGRIARLDLPAGVDIEIKLQTA